MRTLVKLLTYAAIAAVLYGNWVNVLNAIIILDSVTFEGVFLLLGLR